MATITDLIPQYPILGILASHMSTLDLYHLALTNREHYSYIRGSPRIWDRLCRNCHCDSHGLALRQNFSGLYSLDRRSYVWGARRKIWQDEPIEVQLYATRCGEADALPCRKCGVNICEECRYYPREPPHEGYPERRPHLNSPYELENVMCLCDECDAKMESEVKGNFLNELCDCDIYERWICHKCVKEEKRFTSDYFKNHTSHEWDDLYWERNSKKMHDHQHDIMLFCTCGKDVPDHSRPRCTWCKRKHLPVSEWFQEFDEVGSKMPFFDENPCYPRFVGDLYAARLDHPYPPLAYDGPIWQAPKRTESN